MNSKLEYNTTKDWKHVGISPPPYVGSWELGKGAGIRLSMLKKPNWFNRLATSLLLGWVWKDE